MTATKWNRSDRTAEQERRSSGKRRNCCFGRNHFLFCCCFNSLSAHSCVSYRKKEVHRGMATSGTKQDAFNPPTVGRTGGEVEQKAKELSFPSWQNLGSFINLMRKGKLVAFFSEHCGIIGYISYVKKNTSGKTC